mmetsp:Transcript_8768/g.16016  ORF Transcript_8768/g.16016 Transcript_8768/m.16016 type:complete len:120 (+) Transcript_8768:98-457(+)
MAEPVLTKAERLAKVRHDKLSNMALTLTGDLKRDCKVAHASGHRHLTWGAILPVVMPGSTEDMDEVLQMFSENLKGSGFTKIEWCKAAAPTEWLQEAVRFGGHVHLRVHWGEDGGDYFG